MDVKAGYKQTELGVIPEDWNVIQVESIISDISMGPFGSDIKVSNFISEGIPVLSGANLGTERLTDNFVNYVSTKKAKSLKKAVAQRGDIVVTHRGTLGQISYIPNDSLFDSYVISQSQFRVRFSERYVIPAWIVLYFTSSTGSEKLLEGKGHTGVPAIAQPTKTFRQLSVPLPSLREQQAIVEALSDADAYIESLEQRIAKKRLIKQGAMQELLTGKGRLPGFSGEWELKRLGEISEIVSGGTPSTIINEYWNGDIHWCTPTDITSTEGKYLTHTEKRITKAGLKNSSANLLPKGSLLLCSRATIGEVKIAADRICTNQGFKSLICCDQAYNEYLYYVILTIKPKLLEKGIGSTFLEISKKDTAAIEIKLPPFEEQTAIAEILSDMDAEIDELKTKLTKTRQIKQGMMQELLTGRIRLI